MQRLIGKVALITGASRGIGRGTALALAAEGADLVLAARDQDQLHAVAAEIECSEGQVLCVPTDVTDEDQIERFFDQAYERFGRLDILVNNAGAFDGGPLDTLSTESWDRVMAVNLRAPFLCTRAAFQIMKQQGGGRIINIGSISAQRVRPHSAPYSSSKFGLVGLTHVTALEGRDYGITCSCLHPGNTQVERREEETREQDSEPMMSVDELAAAVVYIACQPPHVNVFEMIQMPRDQFYVGRG